ncbi:hypothetical protein ElyMa_003604400, partial [Elysia marginata]
MRPSVDILTADQQIKDQLDNAKMVLASPLAFFTIPFNFWFFIVSLETVFFITVPKFKVTLVVVVVVVAIVIVVVVAAEASSSVVVIVVVV